VKLLFENHNYRSEGDGQFIDLTDEVRDLVARSGVRNGAALIFSAHTTCSVIINERESGFIEDFRELLETVVPSSVDYRHDDLSIRTEGLADDPHEVPNGHAHCRATLLGASSQTVPVHDGELMLGRYQRIFLLELDRGRERRVLFQVMGE
jgi:secondary thiamine-phosphate synthase enzyme